MVSRGIADTLTGGSSRLSHDRRADDIIRSGGTLDGASMIFVCDGDVLR